MTYSLNNKLAEATAMFRVCTLVRDHLKMLHANGTTMETLIQRLTEFYEITSPRLAMSFKHTTLSAQVGHFMNVTASAILLPLGPDEFIDFKVLREFFAKTWPELDIETAIKGPAIGPMFTIVDGREVCIDPAMPVLLEKVGTDWSEGSSTRFFRTKAEEVAEDLSVGQLYRYWSSLVDMVERGNTPLWLEWTHFETFKAWAFANGYQDGYRLARTTMEEGYVPDNVKWQPRHDSQKALKSFWETMKDGAVAPMDLTWADNFDVFEKWALDNGFKRGMAILRKDPNGWYSPENCQVVPRQQPDRSQPMRIRDL